MIERPTEPGFQKLDGFNSPKINYLMIVEYMAKNSERQSKHSKKEYLDEDIDFVQIKTTSVFTKLMCLIMEKGQLYTAERVSVGTVIDSKKKEFASVVCNTCEGTRCFYLYGSDRRASLSLVSPQASQSNFSFYLQVACVTTVSPFYFGCTDVRMNRIQIVRHFGAAIRRPN